jgi:type IV secretory pathway VirB4 component
VGVNRKSTTKTISQLINIPMVYEPSLEETLKRCLNGVFLGYSSMHSMPIFLEFEETINPHALIIGMTGSGKTYLMKNLMLKLCMLTGSSIVLVDFTGEYKEFALTFGISYSESQIEGMDYFDNSIAYFDLSKLDESHKVSTADVILKRLVSRMRRRDLKTSKRVFVLFDEAWKLLRASDSLEIIIREGRKYKVGLLISSQLIEDADLAITSNIATLFVFRTQDKESIEKIVKNYNLSQNNAEEIQNLNIGNFFMIRLYKSGEREAFSVKKFLGIKFETMIKIILGDEMELEIGLERLNDIITGLCGEQEARKITKAANEKGSIELWWLIEQLLLAGAERHRVLRTMSEIGMKDGDIADSFSFALSIIAETHEKSE